MNPWLLLAVTAAVLYGLWLLLRFTFSMIDQAHDRFRAAQASPREGAEHTEGMGS